MSAQREETVAEFDPPEFFYRVEWLEDYIWYELPIPTGVALDLDRATNVAEEHARTHLVRTRVVKVSTARD